MLLCGCESSSSGAPAVTAAVIGHAGPQAEPAMLNEGRSLFVSRCISCHALPSIARYSRGQWPGIVAEMSTRADLKARERDAVVAYLLAVHIP